MYRYAFSDEVRAVLEGLQQPFAVYQFFDNQIITLLVSDGFCELFGYADREQAISSMEHGLDKNIHPEDRERVSKAILCFAGSGDDELDVVYRTRTGKGSEYRVVHAHGKHVCTVTGVRLAHMWYHIQSDIDKALSELFVFEQVGEHMPGGFFIYKADSSEELVYANKAVCEIYGCDSLEDFRTFSGFSFQGMVHPEDYQRVSTSIKNQMSDNHSDLDFVEYRIIRKDGRTRWVEDYGHYIRLDDQNGLYYVFITDTTDKHERAESDKALRSAVIEALTKAYDSVWLINDVESESFDLFRIDKEMEHLLPAHVAVKIKKFSEAFAFYSQLVLEEDRQRFLDEVKPEIIVSNTDNKAIYSIPFRRVFEDGIRFYRLEFAKVGLPGGKAGIVAGFKNVDEEVRKDQQIQRSLNQRAAVIEALTQVYDSVWLISDIQTQRFELYRIDEKMTHILPAQEAVKINRYYDAFVFYSKLVLEEDRQQFLEAVTPEKIIHNTQNKLIYSVPFRRVFENEIRYYRVEFAKLDLGNDEINIVTGFKDVDEEVRKDLQIRQALQEAIDAANASNSAKSDFLSSMSHDMRTPMNGIIGMTTIAINHLDDRERVADCLKKITDSSNHLLSLINEVLDMNKIESGKVELQEEEFCLAELIDGMLAMTRSQMQAHEHSFRVNIVNVEHEQLIGDSRRIEQVFVNIMSNAIKYTPNGGKISLSVRETPTSMPGFGHYQFIFEDNGYGMTEEFLKHLFEPFARANDKQTAGIQGTGLGMAITRNIVRMMGGDIDVESTYGEGSKFTVTMYLKLQNTERIDFASFLNLHILVADDDPVCCESTCELLGDMGMNSEWVLSGKAAVDRVKIRQEQGRDFFAAIIDWKLPDQGGVETVRQIRRLVGANMPIIIFSAYDWTQIEQEAREAGASSFISKPLFRTKLANLFHSLVNNHPTEDLEAPLRKLEEMGLEGRRVLLAEDQELNAEIATDFLEMTGVEVDWAKDGEEAVKLLAASADGYYSMIFMDVQMPNMNGYEATKAIRAMNRPYAKKIPIVAMTANAFAEDALRCKQAGMNDHIAKPIDVEVLAGMLGTYVK
ncbi:MAG: response regulator [Blautia sp.]|nr:response regulator [Blautia sp.]